MRANSLAQPHNRRDAHHRLCHAHLAALLLTALAEIVGCYGGWLWLRQCASAWVLLPAAASLAAFVWLLTAHDTATGRVYAAYGGVYVAVSIGWLWTVDGARPTAWDVAGAIVCLAGMALIAFQPTTGPRL